MRLIMEAQDKIAVIDFINYCREREEFNKRDFSILTDAYFEYINS